MANAIGGFKKDHHIVFGVVLATVGIFGVIGSLTGHLAVMLAALFDPGALIDNTSTTNPIVVPPAADPTGGGSPEEPTSGEPSTPTAPAVGTGSTPELGTGGGVLGELGAVGTAIADAG
jgi:hypothetical protein